eukprot:5999007-Prymnesium_polylepis.1
MTWTFRMTPAASCRRMCPLFAHFHALQPHPIDMIDAASTGKSGNLAFCFCSGYVGLESIPPNGNVALGPGLVI